MKNILENRFQDISYIEIFFQTYSYIIYIRSQVYGNIQIFSAYFR
jgi:hypothetical protein